MDYQFDENYKISEDNLGTHIEHPSFGTVAFYRCTGGAPETLFGSSIYHRDTIRLVVRHASMSRDLHNDWYHGGHEIVEAEMSYSQFVECITNMNNGTGIPCTLRYTEKDGRLPECKFIDKYTQFRTELKEHLTDNTTEAEQLLTDIKELFSKKANIGKNDRAEILKKLQRIVGTTKSAAVFTLDQFAEQMDKTVQEAKNEIESFAQNKMLTIAQQALVEHRQELTTELPSVTLGLPNTDDNK